MVGSPASVLYAGLRALYLELPETPRAVPVEALPTVAQHFEPATILHFGAVLLGVADPNRRHAKYRCLVEA